MVTQQRNLSDLQASKDQCEQHGLLLQQQLGEKAAELQTKNVQLLELDTLRRENEELKTQLQVRQAALDRAADLARSSEDRTDDLLGKLRSAQAKIVALTRAAEEHQRTIEKQIDSARDEAATAQDLQAQMKAQREQSRKEIEAAKSDAQEVWRTATESIFRAMQNAAIYGECGRRPLVSCESRVIAEISRHADTLVAAIAQGCAPRYVKGVEIASKTIPLQRGIIELCVVAIPESSSTE